MHVRLAYPNLYLSERLKDSPLLAQLEQCKDFIILLFKLLG